VITSLASLLSPIHEQSFIEHFLSKSRMHVQSVDNRRTESLLPWDTVNRLLESDQLPPDARQIRDAVCELARLGLIGLESQDAR
jgi:hypothetical protein